MEIKGEELATQKMYILQTKGINERVNKIVQ